MITFNTSLTSLLDIHVLEQSVNANVGFQNAPYLAMIAEPLGTIKPVQSSF
jgi:hypothetical protein